MSEPTRAIGRLRTAMKLNLPLTQAWRQDIDTVLAELERLQNDNAHLRHEKATVWRRETAVPWYHRLLTYLTRRGS